VKASVDSLGLEESRKSYVLIRMRIHEDTINIRYNTYISNV